MNQTLRDEVLEAFAEGRGVAEELGLRRFRVFVRKRTWYSGTVPPWSVSRVGDGYPVDTMTEILPAPKCEPKEIRLEATTGGTQNVSGFRLGKITPRGEIPSLGIEIQDLIPTASSPTADERHIILESRAGTAHHVYEGTGRVLVPGPYDAAGALATVNALRTAMLAHWGSEMSATDVGAHLEADPSTLPDAATDTATAMALANAMRTAHAAHRASLVYHPEADSYPLTAPAATTTQGLLLLAHDLLAQFNLHRAPGPVYETTPVGYAVHRSFTHAVDVAVTRRTPR